jgi:hypothetical protein
VPIVERKARLNHATYPNNPDHDAAEVITFEWHDIKMAAKVTENVVNPLLGTRTIKFVPYEDTIHPYPLAFDPPLIEHAVGEDNGFAHHWEKLSYAFALPNPSDFPILATLTNDDKAVLRRYAAVCRQLAGYSSINNESAITWTVTNGKPDIELVSPTSEAFGGTAIAFRQLHSDDETASFSRAKGRLMKAIKLLPTAEQEAPKNVVTQWAKARGKLMNRLLENIVGTKVGKAGPHPAPDDFPFSYCNVNPQELILTFNYGDTIHFSGEQEKLSTLLETEANAAYYKHAVLLAITNLSHLYFGFAVLAEAAMGTAGTA